MATYRKIAYGALQMQATRDGEDAVASTKPCKALTSCLNTSCRIEYLEKPCNVVGLFHSFGCELSLNRLSHPVPKPNLTSSGEQLVY